MKNSIIPFLGLLLIIFSAKAQKLKYADAKACPFEIVQKSLVNLPDKGFTNPRLSPDGTKMLLTKTYSGVYVIDLKNPQKVKTISNGRMDGFTMRWTGAGDGISFMRSSEQSNGKFKREYFKKDAFLKSTSECDITNFDSPISSLRNLDGNLLIQNDPENKRLLANNGVKAWVIASDLAGICYDIAISPDKTKVAFSCYKDYVYATDGSGLINELHAGLNKSWSPDGKYILYFIDEDRGNDFIVASDLYICKADGSAYWKLTDTPDVLEVYPSWSANGRKISYMDEKTGKIYIADIHKKSEK